MNVVTDHKYRNLLYGYELTEKERKEFDYLDWSEDGDGYSHDFFRYRGELYDPSEFSADWGITRGSGLPDNLCQWDGYISDTFFSGIVIKYGSDCETVKIGRFWA